MTQEEYMFIFFGYEKHVAENLLLNPRYWEIKDIIEGCDSDNLPTGISLGVLKEDTKRILEEALEGTGREYSTLTELMKLTCLVASGLQASMSGGGGNPISYHVTFSEDIEGWRLII